MINRENWLATKDYLRYLERVMQQDEQTLKKRRGQLVHLLKWANDKSFTRSRSIDPTFPVYLLSARNDNKDEPLSPESLKSTCETTRRFFSWLRMSQPRKYGSLSESWVDSIRPARSRGMQSEVKEHEFYTLADMKKIASLELDTLSLKRAQACMCFMYLTGIRVGALLSLPVSCVDLEKRKIYQLPSKGVHTKNEKAAVTSMLVIPELMNVVKEWDQMVREQAPNGSLWYAYLDTTGSFATNIQESTENRDKNLSRYMRMVCDLAGVKYLSSHKERHGHVVFAMQYVHDMAELKAVSQNIMHSSVAITDGVYGNLSSNQVQQIIESLGAGEHEETAMTVEVKQLLEILKSNRGGSVK